jgi:hypothetical protein
LNLGKSSKVGRNREHKEELQLSSDRAKENIWTVEVSRPGSSGERNGREKI